MPAKDLESARVSRRKWYNNNKEKAKASVLARRQELRDWIKDYKASLKCERCGESHWSCLEFHHPNPNEKEGNVASFVSRGFSKERFLKEIEELEVLCANCHRKHHFP